MKLETGWNFCSFTSESEKDNILLTDLFNSLGDSPDIDLSHPDDSDALVLTITTYF